MRPGTKYHAFRTRLEGALKQLPYEINNEVLLIDFYYTRLPEVY